MSTKKTPVLAPVHPWRICPLGQFYRRSHHQGSYVTAKGKRVSGSEHPNECVINKTGKDQIYSAEIEEIAKRYFATLVGPPVAFNLGYAQGNDYDAIIRGWTKYWNEVLNPRVPLDPDLVKALIATESSFDTDPPHVSSARGLMQVMNATRKLLAGDGNDLQDHFVHVDQEDMTDPNLNICAGIRWLFRKMQIAASQSADADWISAIAAYKDYPSDNPQMKKFLKLYQELKSHEKT